MDTLTHVPPGFRFHPTDEELVDYYLRKKVASRRIDLDVIKDVDLYKIEPWDLQELCKIGTEEQSEWYFFSHKDKKYPTGTRTNRATKAGFWKATGRDKAIYLQHSLIGMRKTLVFYKGRAPNGQKSDWIMHEYRLETNENGTPQEEGWVVCRVFKKRMPTTHKLGELDSPCWYEDQVSFLPDFDSPISQQMSHPHPNYTNSYHHNHRYSCKHELELHYNTFLQLPHLESPKVASSQMAQICNSSISMLNGLDRINNVGSSSSTLQSSSNLTTDQEDHFRLTNNIQQNINEQAADQLTDWRVLDKFVASQLSHDASKENPVSFQENDEPHLNVQLFSDSTRQDVVDSDYATISTPTCPIDLWK